MQKQTVEDYLSVIYKLQESSDRQEVLSKDIAATLGISKASVSEMLKKLANNHYINSERYSKISLTKKGVREAKRITHNHRVIEYFLKEVLRCPINKIHTEAHKLEHAFSDETLRKLDIFLGNPVVSPYGKRIH